MFGVEPWAVRESDLDLDRLGQALSDRLANDALATAAVGAGTSGSARGRIDIELRHPRPAY
jgi:hypothetical protein